MTNDKPVTEKQLEKRLKIFKNELKEELTEELTGKLGKVFVTKDEFSDYRDEMMNKMDEIVGILQDMREDKEIGDYQTKERIDDLDVRVHKLERHPVLSA